jgi:hypothetical protein
VFCRRHDMMFLPLSTVTTFIPFESIFMSSWTILNPYQGKLCVRGITKYCKLFGYSVDLARTMLAMTLRDHIQDEKRWNYIQPVLGEQEKRQI